MRRNNYEIRDRSDRLEIKMRWSREGVRVSGLSGK